MLVKGVPGPLCHLVYYMLDCVYGDLSGDECYAKLNDVSFDLHLMMKKPLQFIRDLDIDKLSSSGLHLNKITIPRDDELQTILSCYRKSLSHSCEVAIVKGESGIGKSWLSAKIGRNIIKNGGLFLTAKFDQLKQIKPVSSFTGIC